jgi:hypothetical protein
MWYNNPLLNKTFSTSLEISMGKTFDSQGLAELEGSASPFRRLVNDAPDVSFQQSQWVQLIMWTRGRLS